MQHSAAHRSNGHTSEWAGDLTEKVKADARLQRFRPVLERNLSYLIGKELREYRNWQDNLPLPLTSVRNSSILSALTEAATNGFELPRLVELCPLGRLLNGRITSAFRSPLRYTLEFSAGLLTDPLTDETDCEFVIQLGREIHWIFKAWPEHVKSADLEDAKKKWTAQYDYISAHLGHELREAAYEMCREARGLNEDEEKWAEAAVRQHIYNLRRRLEGYTPLNVGDPRKRLRYSKMEMIYLVSIYEESLPAWRKARKIQLANKNKDWHAEVIKGCTELWGKVKPVQGCDLEMAEYLHLISCESIYKRFFNWLDEKKPGTKVYKWKPTHIAYIWAAYCVGLTQREKVCSQLDITEWRTIKREAEAFMRAHPAGKKGDSAR